MVVKVGEEPFIAVEVGRVEELGELFKVVEVVEEPFIAVEMCRFEELGEPFKEIEVGGSNPSLQLRCVKLRILENYSR